MNKPSPSWKEFLESQNLMQRDDTVLFAQARERLENSQLLAAMRSTCTSINTEAGAVVVEGDNYLAPEPVVSSFTFIKGAVEYVMKVEIWGAKSYLVFMTRKWRDGSSNVFWRLMYRIFDVEPLIVKVRAYYELDQPTASEKDVKQWFFYLLSGLSRSYAPSFPRREKTTALDPTAEALGKHDAQVNRPRWVGAD